MKHFEINEEVVAIESYGYIQPGDKGILIAESLAFAFIQWSAPVMERAYLENKGIHKNELLIVPIECIDSSRCVLDEI